MFVSIYKLQPIIKSLYISILYSDTHIYYYIYITLHNSLSHLHTLYNHITVIKIALYHIMV